MQKVVNVLLVGRKARARMLRRVVGVRLWQAEELMQALSLYLCVMPDVVVIEADAAGSLAEEAFRHLRSVGAKPIVVLTPAADLAWWSREASREIWLVPDGNPSDLERIVKEIAATVPSSFVEDSSRTPPKKEPLS